MDITKEFEDIKTIITDTSKIARDYFDADGRQFETKADKSVVTQVDKAVETALLAYIKERFPGDAIVGEEHGEHTGESGFVWHIDPIDGTDNFLRKVPFCAISVARLGDTPEDSFGIVHNPITGQTFASLMEDGAYENDRVTTLTPDTLGSGYLVTLGHGREEWMKPAAYELFKGVGNKFGRCKAFGSTALELAYVAANRIDAFLTYGLNTYDYAAGLFLVKAAGGAISVYGNDGWEQYKGSIKDLCDRHGKTIFASHPDIHDEIRDFIGNPKEWAKE